MDVPGTVAEWQAFGGHVIESKALIDKPGLYLLHGLLTYLRNESPLSMHRALMYPFQIVFPDKSVSQKLSLYLRDNLELGSLEVVTGALKDLRSAQLECLVGVYLSTKAGGFTRNISYINIIPNGLAFVVKGGAVVDSASGPPSQASI